MSVLTASPTKVWPFYILVPVKKLMNMIIMIIKKNVTYKELTTEVSERYNTQCRLINNYIINKTKKCK